MAIPSPDPDARRRHRTSSGPGQRRWLAVLAISLAVVLLAAALMLLGGGYRTPGGGILGGGRTMPPAASGNPAGVGGPADAADASRIVEVAVSGSAAFEPATVEMSVGEVVTFEVTNTDRAAHLFVLGDAATQQQFAEAIVHMPDGPPHDLANALVLQPGQTKRLTWRFGAAGALEYACHLPGHYEAGIRGQITVQ